MTEETKKKILGKVLEEFRSEVKEWLEITDEEDVMGNRIWSLDIKQGEEWLESKLTQLVEGVERDVRKKHEEAAKQRRLTLINQLSDLQDYAYHALRSDVKQKIQELIDDYNID